MSAPVKTRVMLYVPVTDGTSLTIDREVDHLQWVIGRWVVELFSGTLSVRPKGDAINSGSDVLKVDA